MVNDLVAQTRFFAVFLLLFIVPTSIPLAQGATFNIPNGDVDGLVKAINLANDETVNPGLDEIVLEEDGVYTLTETLDVSIGRSGLPMITSPLIIRGNGATIKRSNADGTPDFRILIVGATGTLDLADVTISNGKVRGGLLSALTGSADGGAILNWGGVVHIRDSNVSDNAASNYGGGIANGGEMIIINSVITDNSSDYVGGGIDNFSHTGNSLDITGTVISNNVAPTGGGISNRGTLLLSQSTLSNNSAQMGGGIANFLAGSLTITATTLSENTAENTGGGINSFDSGSVSVTASIFANNVATLGGGGIFSGPDAVLTVADSTFAGNSVQEEGGGIGAVGIVSVTGSIFADNSAKGGEQLALRARSL